MPSKKNEYEFDEKFCNLDERKKDSHAHTPMYEILREGERDSEINGVFIVVISFSLCFWFFNYIHLHFHFYLLIRVSTLTLTHTLDHSYRHTHNTLCFGQ